MSEDAQPAGIVSRPLDLDPERAGRAGRAPYAIVDIGSNSVRLVVYDQLGRAPLPRFNEKSLCRLGEGLAQTGAIHADGFRRTVEALRRFRAIADAMGVAKLDVTATEAIRRASNGPALAAAIRAETGLEVRILSGAEEARFSHARRDLRLLSPGRHRSATWAAAASKSPRRSTTTSAIVGSACRSARCRSRRCSAEGAPEAKRRIDAHPAGEPAAARSAGRCSTPSAADGARSPRRTWQAADAPVKVVHGYTLRRVGGARVRQVAVAAAAGQARRDAGRARTPRAHLAGGGDGARSRAEAPRAGARRVFRARPARGSALFAARQRRALSRPAGRGRAAHRAAAGARARFRAPRSCRWTAKLFPGETPAGDAPAGRGLRALRHRLARSAGSARRGELSPRAAISVHRHRSSRAGFLAAGDPCALCRPARRALARARRSAC